MGNAIEVSNLCKEYRGFALKNISFSVPEGLCCGFVGPNGAGKTTVMKAMVGMILKSSGEIYLLGKSGGDAKVKEEIGIVFDQPYFQESWTPLDIERSIKPFYHNWDDGEYRKYLSRFELDPASRDEFIDIMREYLVSEGRTMQERHLFQSASHCVYCI